MSNSPTNVDSFVPGSIFQDDIPPPTLSDGTSSSNDSSPSSAGGYMPPGNRSPEIEVNGTTQVVLIFLGIAVGALFLLGVAAMYYITHKNKKAELKRQQREEEEGRKVGGELGGQRQKSLPPIPVDTDQDQDKGHRFDAYAEGMVQKEQMRRQGGTDAGSHLRWSEKDNNAILENGGSLGTGAGAGLGTGYGYGSSRPSTPGSELAGLRGSNGSRNPFATPAGSQFGESGLLAGVSTAASGSRVSGAGAGDPADTRNSIMDVAQAYRRHQSNVEPYLGGALLPPLGAGAASTEPESFEYRDNAPTQMHGNHFTTSMLLDPFKPSSVSVDLAAAGSTTESSLPTRFNEQQPILFSSAAMTATHQRSHSFSEPLPVSFAKNWHCQPGTYTPKSASIILSTAEGGDISYQPPSQPTSPSHRFDYPKFGRVAATGERRRSSSTRPSIEDTHPSLPHAASHLASSSSPSFRGRPGESRGSSEGARGAARKGAAVFEGSARAIRSRSSMEDSYEPIVVSLPSPRGCLLEASSSLDEQYGYEEMAQGSAYDQEGSEGNRISYFEYGMRTSHLDVAHRCQQQHLQDIGQGITKSSYLDDYREKQQQQQQRESSESGFSKLGRKLSTTLMRGSSLYFSSSGAQ
ncbi:hypothetical protein EDD11_010250 [Mortierella claussenii]|nr:hypothetical protein EDD11_010250 [Mortierella claussenii]